jgi:hypothetical protein
MTRKSKDELSAGDEVTWRSHGSTAEGEVEERVADRREEARRTVAASSEDPRYVARSHESGEKAVHKPPALRRKDSE